MRLRPVADDLWVAEMPLFFFGVALGTRMTVARLPNGDLFLHSPIRLDEDLRAELDALGPVAVIAAPNRFHHLFAGEALAAYPQAALYGAPGLETKRKDLAFAAVLGEEPEARWASVLCQHVLAGARKLSEVVFLHRPTRTLIVTDIVQSVGRGADSWSRALLRLNGLHEGPTVSRITRLAIGDRAALRGSVEHLLGWDFDRLILAHGEIVEAGAKDVFARVFGWLTGRASAR